MKSVQISMCGKMKRYVIIPLEQDLQNKARRQTQIRIQSKTVIQIWDHVYEAMR